MAEMTICFSMIVHEIVSAHNYFTEKNNKNKSVKKAKKYIRNSWVNKIHMKS